MAASEVIREFLVALGYKVDKQEQKAFTDSVDTATVRVAALGTALVAAGTAVVAYTNRAAEYGEKLYWLSQRSKSSAAGIEALGYAASQLGSSTDAAYGSVSALGRFLQSSPGAKQWLERWIGPFEKTDDALIKIGRRFKDTPAYFRNMVADTLGLDYDFAQSLYSGDFEKRLNEQRERALNAGMNRDQYAKDATEFKQSWREFWNELQLIGDRAAGELFRPMRDQFEQMTRFLDDHADDWGSDIADSVKSAAASISESMRTLFDIAKSLDALRKGDFSGAADAAKSALGEMFSVVPGGLMDKRSWESPDALRHSLRRTLGLEKSEISSPADAVKFFTDRGWTKEQAVGIASNMQGESGFDPSAVGDGGSAYGAAQWHQDRQAMFRQVYGKDIRGSSLAEQLAFVDWELRNSESAAGDRLRSARSAGDAASIVSRFYERPLDADLEASRRSDLATQMMASLNQTNNITVNGGGNAGELATQIGREVGRQTEQALRSLSGAVR